MAKYDATYKVVKSMHHRPNYFGLIQVSTQDTSSNIIHKFLTKDSKTIHGAVKMVRRKMKALGISEFREIEDGRLVC